MKPITKTSTVTSVFLEEIDDERMRMFFCPHCQDTVAQYKGKIVYLVPGLSPSKVPIIAQCRRCKRKYNFEAFISRQ